MKLGRLSTFIDIGIAPLSLGICFDGTLVLPAIERLKEIDSVRPLFNKVLCELLLGGLYCESVSPEDICYGRMSLTAYTRILGGGRGGVASFHEAIRTKHAGEHDLIRLLKPEMVTVNELNESMELGRVLLKELRDVPPEPVLNGVTYFVKKQWAESLLHLWTTVERVIEIVWDRYVRSSDLTLTKKRKEFLADHRTWTSSAKLELLFQKQLLPAATYTKLDSARRARNEFAHQGRSPGHDAAVSALEGVFELASLCISDFKAVDRFARVKDLAISRCQVRLIPDQSTLVPNEDALWLALPPLPDEEGWGNREYEVIPELCLEKLPRSARTAARHLKR